MEALIEDEIERACDAIELFGWPAIGEASRRHVSDVAHGIPLGHRSLVLIATGFPS